MAKILSARIVTMWSWWLIASALVIAGCATGGAPGSGASASAAGPTASSPRAAEAPPPVVVSEPIANRGDAPEVALRAPGAPGATVYGRRAAREIAPHIPPDRLRDQLTADVRAAARQHKRPAPAPDARLHAVATDLARGLREGELPPIEVVDFLFGHYGLADTSPHLILAGGSVGADGPIRSELKAQLASIFKADVIGRVGVGIHRAGGNIAVVVALQEEAIELGEIPRSIRAGTTVRISGKIAARLQKPEVVVRPPSGPDVELPLGPKTRKFTTDVSCDRGPGRYQVEILAEDVSGPAVLANFPLFCGVPLPHELPRVAAVVKGKTVAPKEVETRILELVNRERQAAGLPPVTLDAKLSDVARAHCHDMVDHDFIGHVSPTTGNALDRVTRAGGAPELLLENVAQAYTADEVHSGLMMSPAHRTNVMNPKVTRIGIGAAYGKAVTGTRPLLVTQLFTS